MYRLTKQRWATTIRTTARLPARAIGVFHAQETRGLALMQYALFQTRLPKASQRNLLTMLREDRPPSSHSVSRAPVLRSTSGTRSRAAIWAHGIRA
jgi:hypothetical protein